MTKHTTHTREAARAYLRHAPFALCLREMNRLLAIETLDEPTPRSPVLDVGCGDGFWWSLRHGAREVYGIDISASEVALAATRIQAARTDVARERPFPDVRFREVIGNCSLEHVPDIDSALKNIRECAAPDARLVLFVPTPNWALHGRMQSLLVKSAPRVAMAIAGALNGFFQHWHLYSPAVWASILERQGWVVESTHGLGSQRSEFLFRLLLPLSFVSFLVKQLTGHYPSKALSLVPDGLLWPAETLLTWALDTPLVSADHPDAYEFMIVCRAGPR